MSKWSDPEFVREYNRQYREKHLERLREVSRQYAAAHKREAVERSRKAYAKKQAERDRRRALREVAKVERRRVRLEKARAKVKQWRAKNPERAANNARNTCHRRRARYRDPGLPWGAWRSIKEDYGYRCAYCGRQPAKLEQEHVEPLSLCGRHNTDNVVPACQSCNRSKSDTPLVLWLARR